MNITKLARNVKTVLQTLAQQDEATQIPTTQRIFVNPQTEVKGKQIKLVFNPKQPPEFLKKKQAKRYLKDLQQRCSK